MRQPDERALTPSTRIFIISIQVSVEMRQPDERALTPSICSEKAFPKYVVEMRQPDERALTQVYGQSVRPARRSGRNEVAR